MFLPSLNPRILPKYIAREIASPLLLALFVFTGILFLARSIKLIDLVVNKDVPLLDIVVLFSYVLPGFLELALPMALLLGTIIAFGRLSADSELVVMRATGVSLTELATPVVAVACCTALLSISLSFWIRPWANYHLGLGMFEIAKRKASAGLTEGTFNDLGQLTIYAENVLAGGQLKNVIISDRRDSDQSKSFVAKFGELVSDNASQTLGIKLFDGSMQEGSGLDLNTTYFQINTINLPMSELFEEGPSRAGKRSGELYIDELIAAIQTGVAANTTEGTTDPLQNARWLVELHKRLGIPTACFCVAFLAMALGIQPSRGGSSWGPSANVIVGIVLIVVYYLLFALASALGSRGAQPIWLIMWVPNILFLSTGVYLFRQVGSERWLAVSQTLGEIFTRCTKKLTFSRG